MRSFLSLCLENLHRFYKAHDDRQGVAVLAFEVDNLDGIQQRYHQLHPQLIVHDMEEYDDGVRIMEVFAYYDATPDGSEPTNTKRADSGTVLRFLERTDCLTETQCSLPGLSYIAAEFNDDAQAAYCDHWVSNGALTRISQCFLQWQSCPLLIAFLFLCFFRDAKQCLVEPTF